MVQSAEIAVLHVLRVTHRVADLFAGQLPVHTLILATSKLIKGRQANLWFWHTSEKQWKPAGEPEAWRDCGGGGKALAVGGTGSAGERQG